jgi:hypothetical protein
MALAELFFTDGVSSLIKEVKEQLEFKSVPINEQTERGTRPA